MERDDISDISDRNDIFNISDDISEICDRNHKYDISDINDSQSLSYTPQPRFTVISSCTVKG